MLHPNILQHKYPPLSLFLHLFYNILSRHDFHLLLLSLFAVGITTDSGLCIDLGIRHLNFLPAASHCLDEIMSNIDSFVTPSMIAKMLHLNSRRII